MPKRSAGAALGAVCAVIGCGQHGGEGNQGGDSGAVNTAVMITVTVAQCPVIDAIVVAPDRVDVGGSAVLKATIGLAPALGEAGSDAGAGEDGDGLAEESGVAGSYYGGSDTDVDVIGLSWSAPSGRFSDASSAETTFTCTTPGTVMVTLTASHQECQVALAVPVNCVENGSYTGGD